MKKYFICFSLMMKRMLKRPAFLVLLIMIPFIAIGMSRLEQGEKNNVIIGIVTENNAEAAWQEDFWKLLQEQDGLLEFCKYDNSELLIQAIEKEELDCGFVLPENFMKKVLENDWRESVILYESSTSTMTEFAKERIACAVFIIYSEDSYVNYIGKAEAFAEAEEKGVGREAIVTFAKEAYQSHLVDGSTFAFEYQGETNQNPAIQEEQFPVRGILAVCIFLSGMCGLLLDWNDRQEKRFVLVSPAWMTTMVNVWVPTIYTSFMSLIALGLLGELDHIGKEIMSLLTYQFLIVMYCSIIRLILRRQETIAVAIPILTLASIVCCPVFIRLALYLPVFRVVEKFFPVTYYLLM